MNQPAPGERGDGSGVGGEGRGVGMRRTRWGGALVQQSLRVMVGREANGRLFIGSEERKKTE